MWREVKAKKCSDQPTVLVKQRHDTSRWDGVWSWTPPSLVGVVKDRQLSGQHVLPQGRADLLARPTGKEKRKKMWRCLCTAYAMCTSNSACRGLPMLLHRGGQFQPLVCKFLEWTMSVLGIISPVPLGKHCIKDLHLFNVRYKAWTLTRCLHRCFLVLFL